MQKSIISWTTVTWNPTFGCHKVSEGCRSCYAEAIALRFKHSTKEWTKANASENVVLKPHKLKEPYRLKEPSRVFVNSMSDLFHENIPDSYIRQVFDVMNDLPQHTFQILTKRPERAAEWDYGWSDNIWMGTSIESPKWLSRLDVLRKCPAHIRFISAEPLIESLGVLDLTDIHWVIVGGESGKGFRPMPHAWARDIRDQCIAQGVAFFFKQSAAIRTEMGIELEEVDGTTSLWQQFPESLVKPVPKQLTLF